MFEKLTEEIQLKFEKILKFTNHSLTIGEYREAVIRDFLRNYLSTRYNISTGFIYDYETKISSKQMDILIIDENYPAAYFLKEDDFVVANKNSVVCAVEIKSTLNKRTFNDIIEKCSSVKKINEKIEFISFCFHSTLKPNGISGLYDNKENENISCNYPNVISIFNVGSLYLKKDEEKLGHYLLLPVLQKDNVKTITLVIFLSSIVKACFESVGLEDNAFNIYKPGLVGRYSRKVFQFNEVK